MKPGHEALLKERYEKRKPVKQTLPAKTEGPPPFMKGRQKPPGDDVRNIKSAAAKRRLEMMAKRNPKGK